jgi:hypothetical protein
VTCEANTECCSGACTCTSSSSNTEFGQCQVPFAQDFSSNTDGWSGVSQHDGLGDVLDSDAFTRWGGYSNVFPANGYTTTLDIYLDLAVAGNDTRFDWDSAVSTVDCRFLRDFVFNVGFYTADEVDCQVGSGNRFVISASNNATRSGADPCNTGHDPITITSSGWYTFTHRFENHDGVLVGTLTVQGASVSQSWRLSDAGDLIGSVVGGNRYGWFPLEEFPLLKIDNSTRK